MPSRNWLKDFSANNRLGSAAIVRRNFLKLAGAVALAFPAMVRARADTPSTKRKGCHMEIKRVGSQPSGKGPADWFTGTVRIDPLFQANAPARAVGASVTFEPGARTAWHTHPLGTDPDRHRRLWLGAARGRAGRGDSAGRRGLVSAGREALARRHSHHCHDANRHSGTPRRQDRRLAGEGHRRAVRQVTPLVLCPAAVSRDDEIGAIEATRTSHERQEPNNMEKSKT